MNLSALITRAVDDHMKAVARRKEMLSVCALVDKVPALRWVEWRQDSGAVAHILISGGQGLDGRWISGFRIDPLSVR